MSSQTPICELEGSVEKQEGQKGQKMAKIEKKANFEERSKIISILLSTQEVIKIDF